MNRLKILYEDNHLLAVAKPPGLATMGVPAGEPSLLEVARDYIKQKYNKPGKVYLGIVSRLDAPVTGVVLLARTSKAASRLTELFRAGDVDKRYLAVVEAVPEPAEDRCVDWVRKDERHRRMHVAATGNPEAKEARLRYRTLEEVAKGTLLEVVLETGRKHQIRLQLAHRGWPIVGDRKYGARTTLPEGIALHAERLRLMHPIRKTELDLRAEIPSVWRTLGVTSREHNSE